MLKCYRENNSNRKRLRGHAIRDMHNYFKFRILRNAVLAEILLFLMVVNCAPNRPREVDHVTGVGGTAPQLHLLQPTGFKRHYRLSSSCSATGPGRGHLMRFLPKEEGGGVDARGLPSDPLTDIVLIAAGWGGKVHIQSSATGEYLCFTKKGKLVTKETIRKDDGLCLFQETLEGNYPRFRSARHPSGEDTSAPDSNWQKMIHLPSAGSAGSTGSTSGWQQPMKKRRNKSAESADWFVGFSRSGAALKGSAWRKQPKCFDIVHHVSHVRPEVSPQRNAFGEKLIRGIYERMRPEAEAPPPLTSTPPPPPPPPPPSPPHQKKKKRRKTKAEQKVALPAGSGSSSSSSRKKLVNKVRVHPEKKWKKVPNSGTVDFDSYLAETERLLRHPAEALAQTSHSAFILLDSGGWKEVLVHPES